MIKYQLHIDHADRVEILTLDDEAVQRTEKAIDEKLPAAKFILKYPTYNVTYSIPVSKIVYLMKIKDNELKEVKHENK